jgi:hypothetical protein
VLYISVSWWHLGTAEINDTDGTDKKIK